MESESIINLGELYRGSRVDIVHLDSLRKAAERKKGDDIERIKDAQRILKTIHELAEQGIPIEYIEDVNLFEKPSEDLQVKVGGAFVGQCIDAYKEAANKSNYQVEMDPLLSLR